MAQVSRYKNRQTITLTQPQVEDLRAESERLGIPLPELVRRILDDWREKRQTKKQSDKNE